MEFAGDGEGVKHAREEGAPEKKLVGEGMKVVPRKKGIKGSIISYLHRLWPSLAQLQEGNPEDIAALTALRGPPKKKRKTTKSSQTSIVTTSFMSFPPSQSLESTTMKQGETCHLRIWRIQKVRSGSSQPVSSEHTIAPVKAKDKRKKKATTSQKQGKNLMLSFDSPAMGTGSKKNDPASHAMSTGSKRRLSL